MYCMYVLYVCVYVCVAVCVCMCVCMYVCMYVRMYVCVYVQTRSRGGRGDGRPPPPQLPIPKILFHPLA